MMRHLLGSATNKNVFSHLENNFCRPGHLCSTPVLVLFVTLLSKNGNFFALSHISHLIILQIIVRPCSMSSIYFIGSFLSYFYIYGVFYKVCLNANDATLLCHRSKT